MYLLPERPYNGFTLIELLITLAIIAILAIVVLGKYINLSSTAQTNTTNYFATKLNSSANMNYYARTLNSSAGVSVTNCKNVVNTLQTPLPSGYTISSKNIPANTLVNCTLKGPDKTTASFYARGIR